MEMTHESVILDFSLWSDVIFAYNHHDNGYLTDDQLEQYLLVSREILGLRLPPPHLSILLQTSPGICAQRAQASATRSAQRRMSQESHDSSAFLGEAYMRAVDELYQHRWLHAIDRVCSPKMAERRIAPSKARLPAAPSLLILVRDWSNPDSIKPTQIADVMYCTEPTNLDAWLGPFASGGQAARVQAVLDPEDQRT